MSFIVVDPLLYLQSQLSLSFLPEILNLHLFPFHQVVPVLCCWVAQTGGHNP